MRGFLAQIKGGGGSRFWSDTEVMKCADGNQALATSLADALTAHDPGSIRPNAAVGAFYKGNGKDLGSVVEFKTGAEFAYRFEDHSRLGLQFDHISNAGIGKRNPGTESLVLFWSFPFGAVQR